MKYHFICTFICVVLLSSNVSSAYNDVSVENNIKVNILKNFSAEVQQILVLNLLNEKTAESVDTSIALHTNHSLKGISSNQGSISNHESDSKFLYITIDSLSWTKNSSLKIYLNYTVDNIVEKENNLTYFDFAYRAFGNSQQIPTDFIIKMDITFPYGLDPQKDEKYLAYFGLPNYDKNLSVNVYKTSPLMLSISKNVKTESDDFLFRFIFILFDKPSFSVILKDKLIIKENEIEHNLKLTNLYNLTDVYYRIVDGQLSVFDENDPLFHETAPRKKLNSETEDELGEREMKLTDCSLIYPFECYTLSNTLNLASYFNPDIRPIDFILEHGSEFSLPKNYVIDVENSFISYCPEMVRFPSELIEATYRWGFDVYSPPISDCTKNNFVSLNSLENNKFKLNNKLSLHHPQYTTNIITQIKFTRNPLTIIFSFIIAIIPVIWLVFIRYWSKTKKSTQRKNKKLHYGGIILPVIGWIAFYSQFFDINKMFIDLIFWILIIVILTTLYFEFFRKKQKGQIQKSRQAESMVAQPEV